MQPLITPVAARVLHRMRTGPCTASSVYAAHGSAGGGALRAAGLGDLTARHSESASVFGKVHLVTLNLTVSRMEGGSSLHVPLQVSALMALPK